MEESVDECTFLILTGFFDFMVAFFSSQAMSEFVPPSLFDAALLFL